MTETHGQRASVIAATRYIYLVYRDGGWEDEGPDLIRIYADHDLATAFVDKINSYRAGAIEYQNLVDEVEAQIDLLREKYRIDELDALDPDWGNCRPSVEFGEYSVKEFPMIEVD